LRINKYLSSCGVCSRRMADSLAAGGSVRINGSPAEPGSRVEAGDVVTVDGTVVSLPETKTYLKFYKPTGVVGTFEKKEKNNLTGFLPDRKRVTYAGRLDKNSEGLLILTDDGDLIQNMMAARNAHEKEYEVTVGSPVTDEFLEQMRNGVYLPELKIKTRPCRAWKTGERKFRIVLTQGLNRQIRRMCGALGFRVVELKRFRVVNVLLGDLQPGESCPLTGKELETLLRITGRKQDSTTKSAEK
jgi:23S rRNA pseudouridine2604 synthase